VNDVLSRGQRRARGRQPPCFGHKSCGVGGADGGSVAVVVGAIVDSTPEPTANRTAVLFELRERPSTSPSRSGSRIGTAVR